MPAHRGREAGGSRDSFLELSGGEQQLQCPSQTSTQAHTCTCKREHTHPGMHTHARVCTHTHTPLRSLSCINCPCGSFLPRSQTSVEACAPLLGLSSGNLRHSPIAAVFASITASSGAVGRLGWEGEGVLGLSQSLPTAPIPGAMPGKHTAKTPSTLPPLFQLPPCPAVLGSWAPTVGSAVHTTLGSAGCARLFLSAHLSGAL